MTEDERVKNINKCSAGHLEDFLKQLDEGEISHDEMAAIAYAAMVTVALIGFSPEAMAVDAIAASERLIDLLNETDA